MDRPPIAFEVAKRLAWGLIHSILNVRIDGLDNMPEDGPYMLVSNHLNWIDPFFIYAHFPSEPRIIFVADQESLVDEGWKRSFLELVGKPVIVLDRFKPRTRLRAIRQMMKLLRTGHVLGVFPEGRLGPGEDELYPFHVGPFMVAKKLEVPVLPMYISGTFKLALRKPVHINIGEPTSCGEDENYRDFARRLALTLNDLRPPYPGNGPFPNTWNWLTDLFLSEPRRPDPGYRALIIPEGGSAWKDTSDSAH